MIKHAEPRRLVTWRQVQARKAQWVFCPRKPASLTLGRLKSQNPILPADQETRRERTLPWHAPPKKQTSTRNPKRPRKPKSLLRQKSLSLLSFTTQRAIPLSPAPFSKSRSNSAKAP